MKLLVSIHDVMPETLEQTRRIFERLRAAALAPVTLLVVPGRDWHEQDLEELRALVGRGAILAGHGWRHEIQALRGPAHRLHAALISRRAAEHLALPRRGILRLMLNNHRWFIRRGFAPPELYVPPAWAMGAIPRHLLDRLPFRFHETLGGVYDVRARRFRRLPMAGFEADTALRAAFVRPFNGLNRVLARSTGAPLRLGIHPHDDELKLASDLETWIRRGGTPLAYTALADSA